MQYPSIKFTYFDKVDRAETIRLAFIVSGIPFDDVRVGPEQWEQMKLKTPFQALPTMEVDGMVYSQANAILRYIGHIGGLLSTAAKPALRVDEIIGAIDDMIYAIKPTIHIDDQSRMLAERARLTREVLPRFLNGIESKICREQTGYCVDVQYSIADIALYNIVHWFKTGQLEGIPSDITDKYKNITAVYDQVFHHDGIVRWYQTHDR